jgi:hypothetical protein
LNITTKGCLHSREAVVSILFVAVVLILFVAVVSVSILLQNIKKSESSEV